MKNFIHSPDQDIDTLRCPVCGVIWRSKGFYEYDLGGWTHEESECPNGCVSKFLKLPISGIVIPRD